MQKQKMNIFTLMKNSLKEEMFFNQANAWLVSFKALLIRIKTKAQHWLAFHFLTFAIQLIRKINKNKVLNRFIVKIYISTIN